MQLIDDTGNLLDAEYEVEADGSDIAIILQSCSGSSNARAARNPALELLLSRLGQLRAVLADALVDSHQTQQLEVQQRRPSGRRFLLA